MKVAIIGQGYVGLTIAEGAASAGYEVVGYDYQNYNKKTLKRMLRILRNVYNYY